MVWDPFVLPEFDVFYIIGNLVGTLNTVPPAFLDVSPGGGGVFLGRTLKEVIFIPQHRSPKLAILVIKSPCQANVHGFIPSDGSLHT